MRSVGLAALAVLVIAGSAQAQNEAALRAALEGKVVTVKLDMPATSQGVEVYPLDQIPVNFREVAERIKDNGTAIRMGQQVMITKVVIKGRSHIEVQLGGGGYGTFGDWLSSPSSSSAVQAGETREERELREQIRNAADRDEKKRLERELSSLRSARERDNARAVAEAAQANEARETNMRAKRLDSGSRFNVRYRHGLPPEAITPEGVMRALAQYVDFPGQAVATVTGAASGAPASAVAQPAASPAPVAGGLGALKKGLALNEVETILGAAVTAGEVQEGAMKVMKRSYAFDGMKVATSFVGGVLIDFAITPQ